MLEAGVGGWVGEGVRKCVRVLVFSRVCVPAPAHTRRCAARPFHGNASEVRGSDAGGQGAKGGMTEGKKRACSCARPHRRRRSGAIGCLLRPSQHRSPRLPLPLARAQQRSFGQYSSACDLLLQYYYTAVREPAVQTFTCSDPAKNTEFMKFGSGVIFQTKQPGSGGRCAHIRAPFSTDTASHTHTARSLACPLLTLSPARPFSNGIFRSNGAPASLPPASSSLTHARRMDGFCNQNADQLGSLAGPPLLTVYVGVVECAPASLPRVLLPHTCTQDGWFLQPKRQPALLPRRTPP
jgi:hypothetical protein